MSSTNEQRMASLDIASNACSKPDPLLDEDEGIFKVDFHTHYVPRHMPDFATRYGYGGFVSADYNNNKLMKDGKTFMEVPEQLYDIQMRVDDMDHHSINVQVISHLPALFNYWAKADDTADSCRILNNDLHKQTRQHQNRFLPLGTLPMQAPELAIKELQRCIKELGFVGVQIGTHINEWNLDAPELAPFWEACEELSACVFVHPCDMEYTRKDRPYNMPQLLGMPHETTRAIVSLLLGGVLDRFPKLKICFADGGGSYPYLCGRVEQGFNVMPEICGTNCDIEPSRFIGKFFCDSAVQSSRSLELLVDVIGEDNVVFGTNYPLQLGEGGVGNEKGMYPGKFMEESEKMTLHQKAKVYGKNAMRFLAREF